MSYILDALEKAEAQRAREAGGARDALLPPAPREATRGRGTRPLAWVMGLVLALVAGWGLGLLWQGRTEMPLAAPAPDQVTVSTTVSPLSAPTTTNTITPPSTPAVPAAPTPAAELRSSPQATPAPATPSTAAPILAPATVAPPAPRVAAEPTPATKPTETRAGAPTATNQASASAAASSVVPASVGPLAVQGVTYSSNAALRMLIVNGQVLQEGQELAPGLTLEAIGPRSAVFNRQGHRFNVNY